MLTYGYQLIVDNVSNSGRELIFGDFGTLYASAWGRTGLTQVELAKRILDLRGVTRDEKKIGTVQSQISQITHRKSGSPFPLDDLEPFLDAVELSDEEYVLLYRKAIEQFAPLYVTAFIARFERWYLAEVRDAMELARRMKLPEPAFVPFDYILTGRAVPPPVAK